MKAVGSVKIIPSCISLKLFTIQSIEPDTLPSALFSLIETHSVARLLESQLVSI